MIKKLTAFLLAVGCLVLLFACGSDSGNEAADSASTESTAEVTTTAPSTTTTTTRATKTTTIYKTTVTAPPVQMPDDTTNWANYIVDGDYNYIADLLTKAQKSNVTKMATMVGCKVVFEETQTVVTDTQKKTVVYSKDFPEEIEIENPDFGVLTLTRQGENETLLIYKVVGIQHFVSYTKKLQENSFPYYTQSDSDYMKGEAIFIGENENGDSVIVKLQNEMLIISITHAEHEEESGGAKNE